jgi:cellulose biosynthesis protein BcsQ
MIDGDPGTDGLSLFLLGPKGQEQVGSFDVENTFIGVLASFKAGKPIPVVPRHIHRRGEDHGVTYSAVISGKGLYGEEHELTAQLAVPDLDRATFRAAVKFLFDGLRASGEFNYVLIDTRGGFAFESTDVCALADSFIVVTEPDFTSFYQDRNLVARISHAAKELDSPSLLRGIIVNKATDTLQRSGPPSLDDIEVSFRNELVREFGIKFHETYPVPVDIDALLAYKVQRIPYTSAPGSPFAFATLAAFSDILQIVTSRWSIEQVDKWNELVELVSAGVKEKRRQEDRLEEQRAKRETEWEEMQAKRRADEDRIASLERELAEQEKRSERDLERTRLLIQSTISARDPNINPSPQSGTSAPKASSRIWIPVAVAILILVCAICITLYALYSSDRARIAKQAADYEARLAEASKQTQINEEHDVKANPLSNQPPTTANPVSRYGDSISGNYAIVLSDDETLQPSAAGQPSAIYEADLAHRLGLTSVALFENQGQFSTVVRFDSIAEAKSAEADLVSQFNSRWRGAYTVPLGTWCPTKTQSSESPVAIKGSSVPLWVCTNVSGFRSTKPYSPTTNAKNPVANLPRTPKK